MVSLRVLQMFGHFTAMDRRYLSSVVTRRVRSLDAKRVCDRAPAVRFLSPPPSIAHFVRPLATLVIDGSLTRQEKLVCVLTYIRYSTVSDTDTPSKWVVYLEATYSSVAYRSM